MPYKIEPPEDGWLHAAALLRKLRIGQPHPRARRANGKLLQQLRAREILPCVEHAGRFFYPPDAPEIINRWYVDQAVKHEHEALVRARYRAKTETARAEQERIAERERRRRRWKDLVSGKAKPNPKLKKKIHQRLFAKLLKMPKLSNWPDRSKPWSAENSPVCQWIQQQIQRLPEYDQEYMDGIEYAAYVRDMARSGRFIVYDRSSRLWRGYDVSE